MRLIEADKAIEATWEQPTYTDPLNVLTEVRDRIKELPTVEAIPVEWIKEQKQKYDSIIERLSGIAEYDDYVDDAIVRTNTLNNLLCAWAERKEE